MIELQDWLKHVKDHPLLYRFDGLHSRGRSAKSDFHRTVGDAAVSDESYMDAFMSDQEEAERKALSASIAGRDASDESLVQFARFCEGAVTARRWSQLELPDFNEDMDAQGLLKIVDAFSGDEQVVSDYIRDWVMSSPETYWDMIREDPELPKNHEPLEAWNHGSGCGVALKDIFVVCPACGGEPITEEDLIECYGKKNGYPYFYCGSCGSSMQCSDHEDIRDFFLAMDVKPYPFNPKKAAEWQESLEKRKAFGENKLELKHGDKVILDGEEEPVMVQTVRNTSSWANGISSESGFSWVRETADTYQAGWARFHKVKQRL